MAKPKGAEYYVDGLYWKLGFNGVVYRHNGEEWVSSTRSIEEIRREDHKKTWVHYCNEFGLDNPEVIVNNSGGKDSGATDLLH